MFNEEPLHARRAHALARVGATLPAEVELHAVPSDWGPSFGRYRYVYVDDDVVLVEPSSRKMIQIIE